MRLLIAATFLGLALGAALLGRFEFEESNSATAGSDARHTGETGRTATVPGPEGPPRLIAAHSDSNSQGNTVYLNQNVIDGETTTICTTITNQRLQEIIDHAVELWNNALNSSSNGLGFNVFSTVTACSGADIEVVFNTPPSASTPIACMRTFNSNTGGGTWACLDTDKSDTNDLPRRTFTSLKDASRGRALLIYQALAYQPASKKHEYVMAHELGHALGLAHYENQTTETNPHLPTQPGLERCNALRAAMPSQFDVDPQDDDYTTLTGPFATCASHQFVTAGHVTGRDLRDFYEAYQVGAITNVQASLVMTTAPMSIAPLKLLYFRWTEDDAREAAHNAKYVAVVGRASAHATGRFWKELKTIPIRNSQGQIMRTAMLNDEASLDRTEHKIVGLTRGGLHQIGNETWALQLPTNPPRTSASILGTDRWVMGDPTHVFGDVWNSTGPQLYLSVSISPNACYVSGSGAAAVLPATWTVGSSLGPSFSSAVNLLVSVNGAIRHNQVGGTASGTTNIPCSQVMRGGLLDVAVAASATATLGNSRNQTVAGSVYIQDRNHDGALSFRIVSVPSSCTEERSLSVIWTTTNGVQPIDVWIAGVKDNDRRSPTVVPCPSGTRARVRGFALAADGSGDEATSSYFTVVQPPSTPTSVRVSGKTATSATLTWINPTGSSNVTYGLWRSGGQNAETTSASYTFNGLTPYRTYNLYVWSKNAAGAESTKVKLPVTLPGRPGVVRTAAPTGVRTSGVTTNSATLNWNAVSGATGYSVWRSGGPVVDLPATARSHTFTGLLSARRYALTVRAIGYGGISTEARLWQRTLGPAPSAPSGLRTTINAGAASATLRWNAVNGAAGYDLWRSGGQNEQTTSTSHTFSDLIPYRGYNLYVRARDASGAVSTWAIVSVSMPGRPGVPRTASPTGLRTSGVTSSSVTLHWSAVAGATRYKVWRSGEQGVSLAGTARSYTFTYITIAGRYTLGVRAFGRGGVSRPSKIQATIPAPATTPTQPTGLSVAAARTSLTLTWSAVTGATSYEVKRGASGAVAAVSSGRRHPFSGLSAGNSYTLYVRAKNSAGTSGWSSITGTTTPSQPSGLSVSPTHNSLTLSWRSVSGATSYDVKLRHDGTVKSVATTSHTFSGLTSNTSYTLFVRARNAGGVSLWNSYTGTTTPPQPTGLRYSATSTSITLSWTADILADRYGVKRGASGSESGTSRASYTFSGLTANTSYTLYVRAKTPAGSSPWSSLAVRTAPARPTRISANTFTTTSITLSWPAVSGATSYEVRKGSGSAIQVSGTSYRFTNLSVDAAYTLAVRAKNGGRRSAWASMAVRTGAFEGLVRARSLSDGRVEFCFQITGRTCTLPSARYLRPLDMDAGRWYHSSSISGTVNSRTRTLGKISVSKPSGQSYLNVCFTPAGGSRVCTTKSKFRWATATVNQWLKTDTRAYRLPGGASGSADADDPTDGAMQPPQPNEPNVPDADGGLMGSDP